MLRSISTFIHNSTKLILHWGMEDEKSRGSRGGIRTMIPVEFNRASQVRLLNSTKIFRDTDHICKWGGYIIPLSQGQKNKEVDEPANENNRCFTELNVLDKLKCIVCT